MREKVNSENISSCSYSFGNLWCLLGKSLSFRQNSIFVILNCQSIRVSNPAGSTNSRLRVKLQVMTKPGFNKKNWGYHLRPLPLYKFALLAMNRRSYEIVQAQEEGSVSLLTVPKIIDFSRYNMKGGNVILRGIVHVVSCFPPRRVKTTIHLLQEYWQNMQYLIESCRQESNLNFRPAIKTMLI